MNKVWHRGMALLVRDEVLVNLGLHPEQTVSADDFWRVIRGNAEQFCKDMAEERAKGHIVPDTSELEAMIKESKKNDTKRQNHTRARYH